MKMETTDEQAANEALFKTWLDELPRYKTDGNADNDAIIVAHIQRGERDGQPVARVQGMVSGDTDSIAECLRQLGANDGGVAGSIMFAADLIVMDLNDGH